MDGVLVIDKPAGPTSHDVVARVRRVLRESRIGHTGTLDPGASGVLPLVIGRATRLARFLSASDKHYDAVIRLGWCTDTGDAHGARIGAAYAGVLPGRAVIEAALDGFRGTFLQQPPAYSAKKIAGHRSYALARAKADVLPAPASVTAHTIAVVGVDGPLLTVRIACSAGFYVRSLADDLGNRLGVGAHLTALRRTASGAYTLSDAIALDIVERDRETAATAIVPLARLLQWLPRVVLTSHGATHARQGRELGPADVMSGESSEPLSITTEAAERGVAAGGDGWVRLLDAGGQLLGLARATGDSGFLHPSVLLV
jgi:tRNA pseudouridine55 synthase